MKQINFGICLITLHLLTSIVFALDVSLADSSIMNTKDLKAAIYTKLQPSGDACIRLLNATGITGCAAPSSADVVGPLTAATASTAAEDFPQGAVAVVPALDAGKFLQRCLKEPDLQQRVAGVLIQHSLESPGWNEAALNPYAIYSETTADYPWNPVGVDIASQSFPFPVFQLDNVTSENAVERAEYNADNAEGARNVARMDVYMEGNGNSTKCIADKACYPLGGNSVWAMLPPLPPSTVRKEPLILLVAQIDSRALFHNIIEAADSPLSGLITMLTAAQVLGSSDNAALVAEKYKKRIGFLAMMGEPWDYMGSRRLLWELEEGSDAVSGLALDSIEAYIEVGQLGRAARAVGGGAAAAEASVSSSAAYQLYAHTAKSGPSATASAPLTAALTAVSSTTDSRIILSNASSTTPGLPPSTATSFLRQRPDLPVVILEEFDTSYLNPSYHSQYDTIDRIDPDAITAASIFLARAVNEIALQQQQQQGAATVSALNVNETSVRETVDTLLGCLAAPSPGMACPLVNALMTPLKKGAASHYVGILRTTTQDSQSPDANVQSDVERFVWNYLAFTTGTNLTADPALTPRCRPDNASTACPAGSICAGYRDIKGYEGAGVCINATTKYVPSYSTALECIGCNGTSTYYDYRWNVTDTAKEWELKYGWPPDPMWTESNWPNKVPHLELYLEESSTVDYAVLAAGLSVTAATAVAAGMVKFAWAKRLKRD